MKGTLTIGEDGQAHGVEPGDTLSLGEVERRHIARVLAATHGNKTMAARILGIDRKTLHRKLVQYARSSPGYENDAAAHHG
jgi:two-component system response regulator HydG